MTESILKMENLYFSHFDFHRNANLQPYNDNDVKLGFGKKTDFDNDVMTLNIMFQAILDDAFELRLTATGIFSCTSGEIKLESLEKNAMSIMFPFIRSEVTLLTSQPNFKSIMIPPINIKALFDMLSKENQQEE